MKVITVKLNEASWAYIATYTKDVHFVEQELTKTLDICVKAATKYF